MPDEIKDTKDWYEASYHDSGLKAQRRYPNEELIRFMGRNYFAVPLDERGSIHILEIGCGSCANLWMIAREGFNAHGLDLSEEAIRLGEKIMNAWGTRPASLKAGSMTDIPYEDESLDAVVDVFSCNCLDESDFEICLREVGRVLKPGGHFFSFTPGQGSEAFRNHAPAEKLDSSTLNGIHRKDSPYTGNHYPFRFSSAAGIRRSMELEGFQVRSIERVTRSHFNDQEIFEHLTVDAVKIPVC